MDINDLAVVLDLIWFISVSLIVDCVRSELLEIKFFFAGEDQNQFIECEKLVQKNKIYFPLS